MRKLRFNMLMVKALFMQYGRSQATKTMTCHPTAIAHPLKGFENRVVRHWRFSVSLAWEHELKTSG